MTASYGNFGTHDESQYPELWRGCVGAWNPGLGPSGGRLFDWSPYRNHGTLIGSTVQNMWQVNQGKYSLLHASSHVAIPGSPQIDNLRSLTLSAWVRIDANPTGNYRAVLSKHYPPGGTKTHFSLVLNNTSNTFAFYHYNGVTGEILFSSTSIPLGRWTHLAARTLGTIGSSLTIHMNGLQVAASTLTVAITPDTLTGLSIGKYGASLSEPQFFVGNIDDALIYNRVLHPSEIRLLASRRGIAYERRHRQAYSFVGPTFNPAWASRSNTILQPFGAIL